MFSAPSTPKTYYHPTSTTPKAARAKVSIVGEVNPINRSFIMQLQAEGTGNGRVNITLHKAEQGPAAHTLQPFTRGPLNLPPSSSSPQSGPVWDLKYSPPDHWGGACAADLSSGGSSKFDESWPSKSEESPSIAGGGCGPSAVGVGPDGRGAGSVIVEQEDQLSESRESTLARYGGHTHTTTCRAC